MGQDFGPKIQVFAFFHSRERCITAVGEGHNCFLKKRKNVLRLVYCYSGKTNLPFFRSHRTNFRPGFLQSRAQDVSRPDPRPTQEYRMGILVPFIRVLLYIAGTGSPVSSPVLCMVVQVGGRCRRKCDVENNKRTSSESSSSRHKARCNSARRTLPG